jgi:hypothetical protein
MLIVSHAAGCDNRLIYIKMRVSSILKFHKFNVASCQAAWLPPRDANASDMDG